MLEQLIELDKTLFLAINGFHSPFFDHLMVIFSAPEPWIPFYVAIALALFFSFKWEVSTNTSKPRFHIIRKPMINGFILLFAILLTFAFTDIVSTQIKHFIERPRPCYDEEVGNLARMLEGKGGLYGFISSHAANVFGLAILTTLIFRNRLFSIVIFFWATMVCYSRVYVGKHFPLDVICGALFGLLTGLTVFLIVRKILQKINSNSEK